MRRGERPAQALVEFAIVLPIILVLLVGIFAVGIGMKHYNDLAHATTQAADAGADSRGRPRQCRIAGTVADEVFGADVRVERCQITSRMLELTTSWDYAVSMPFMPFDHWTLRVTERSALR